ncbi:MAG: glycosyltransferase family 2 protein [Lachnospiraceae bacterium]|nr:glycosyltransferase family 2 protein [Lachnospiraceae bacterium]
MRNLEKEMVSVVIPSYNRKQTICDCINSVLGQTYQNLEIIVVDDGSDDGTFELFRKPIDPRVRFYRYDENKGACYARNLGCNYAKGEYIAFQDSDDIWHPEKIEKQLACLKKNNADFVFCGMNRINPLDNSNFYYPNIEYKNGEDALSQILTNNPISTQTILLKREVVENVRFDTSFKRYQDWDYALQVAKAGYCIIFMNEALVDSIIQTNSISSTVKNSMGYIHLYEKYSNEYKRNRKAHASILTKLAISVKDSDINEARAYLAKSLQYKFTMKNIARLLASYCGLWK